jgi:aminoglycoside/choline kinase family phosphotransferase
MTEPLTQSPAERLMTFVSRQFPGRTARIESLPGDASTRAYFRLFAEGESYIAATYAEAFDSANFPYLDVTELFLEAGIAVPRVVAADGAAGVVLQEDLGDRRFQDALTAMTPEERAGAYRAAADIIIDFQKTTPLAEKRDSIAWRLAFDDEKLFWEMNYFFRNYCVRYRKLDITPEYEAILLGELFALSHRLANVRRVVCHRDYHARNLMVQGTNLRVIDHQDARMGPATYDIVSLVGDPYAALEPDFRDELVNHFWEAHVAAFGTTYYADRAAFDAEYHLMMIQRMIKAVGTYAFQAAVRNNPLYVGYIPHAFAAAAKSLAHVAGMPETTELVMKEVGSLES